MALPTTKQPCKAPWKRVVGFKARSQWSPYLEKCCLLVSANESYQRAAEDIATLTGITVSSSTQQD
jgi:hypothetical protein